MPEPNQATATPRALLRRRLGRALVLAGVAVWGVWLVVELTGGEPAVADYLPFHLAGVVPGALLHRWDWLRRLFSR